MQERVTINVSGKIYETTHSTISKYEDTLLSMLLKHSSSSSSLFIDRDQKLFRWILYWYQTGTYVDHKQCGVSAEMWQEEMEYYGILPKEVQNEVNKKRKLDEELVEKASNKILEINKKEEDDKEHRQKLWKRILSYMIDFMKDKEAFFDIVGGETFENPYDYDVRVKNLKPVGIKYWFEKEFKPLCEELGFLVTMISCMENTTRSKYEYLPGKLTRYKKSHQDITIKIKKL